MNPLTDIPSSAADTLITLAAISRPYMWYIISLTLVLPEV